MSDYPDPFIEHGFEGTECFRALDTLDATEILYWESCANFAEKPSGKKFTGLTDSAQEHVDAFRQYVDSAQEQDICLSELSAQIVNTLRDKDARRVAFLNILLKKDILKPTELGVELFDDEELLDPDELTQTKLGLSDYIVSKFEEYLVSDTTIFINNVERLPAARLLKAREQVAHHLIDIGKIAIGTGIALVLSKSFGRNA